MDGLAPRVGKCRLCRFIFISRAHGKHMADPTPAYTDDSVGGVKRLCLTRARALLVGVMRG